MKAGANQPDDGGHGSRAAGAAVGVGATSSSARATPADGAVRAAVVVTDDDKSTSTYEMFEATELTGEGAFLSGEVFLEVGELVNLQLAADGQTPIRAQARVVRLERGSRNGMAVAFQDIGDDERRALQDLAARAAER